MKIVSRDDAISTAQVMLDKKALDVVLLDISSVVPYADYFLICSGRSFVQVKAIVTAVEDHLKEQGFRPLHIEGYRESRWVLLDYDDMIVHVFLEEAREFYNLERLWGNIPRTEFTDQTPADSSLPRI
jgi:ribosome-associated protein